MNERSSKSGGSASKSARELAMDVLTRVEKDKAYSNLLLNQLLQKHKLERHDAGLATELVYGTIQRLNTIDHFLAGFVAKGIHKLEPWVRSLLRLSFYQIYYLQRIPAHAAVNEAVNIAKRKGHQGISGMVNGVLRNVLRQKSTLTIAEDMEPVRRISLLHSHPEWMVARWIRQFGEAATAQMCAANNEAPHASVRVNRLKRTREEMLEAFAAAGIEAVPSPLAPRGIIASGGGNLAFTSWYAGGEITIQDESSMLVGEAVAPLPGMRVLDCCAAPGGKTTHLAEKMGDSGTIVACDLHPHKEQLIREQADRLGLSAIQTIVGDAEKLDGTFAAGSFDCILLDAPCSGLGVIRRKPDLKWAKAETDIADICGIQHAILESVHNLLKPGGLLVYSTCTIERSENEEMVERFLASHPEFSLEAFPSGALPVGLAETGRTGMVQLLPHHYHSDGFFIARLRKA
ncbi:16S rRNA (cytosine(967)-C(5))-methyltransferase RsmB [Paenibacillus sp. MBLB4367]|uniref:16S rRNA (cytosine(967)-C(5))-methyltransferase RsmB n=1 Tax=Paenibacillus sp. MBLB4367 TaxID=3384767 RepID=UPI00390837C5